MHLESIVGFSLFSLLLFAGNLMLSAPAWAEQVPGGATAASALARAQPQTVTPLDTDCNEELRTAFPSGSAADLIVTISPETAWQHIGGKVKFTVEGNPVAITALAPRACFGWRKAGKDTRVRWFFAPLRVLHSEPGKVTYGGMVPSELDEDRPALTFPWSSYPIDGLGLVPLAQFRVLSHQDAGG